MHILLDNVKLNIQCEKQIINGFIINMRQGAKI